MWLISVRTAGFLTLCCTHHSPERTPELPHGPEGGGVPLAVNGAHLQSSSSVVCLHLLTFGRSFSARPEKVQTYLPVLPPAPATPAHLPHLLQASKESSCEDSDPQPQAGRQGCVLQSTCSPTQEARLLLPPVVPGSLSREQPSPHRAACSGACPVFAWACSCLSAAVQMQPCLPCSPRPLLTPQLCSLWCSGLATPRLGKQELILPHEPGALQPQLPQARSAPLFFSQVNLPFIIQQI